MSERNTGRTERNRGAALPFMGYFRRNESRRRGLASSSDWHGMKGKLGFSMRNDYLFRAFLQEDRRALVGLVAACLHIGAGEIRSAEITNPISLGRHIGSKGFILDILVLLNGNLSVNLEMQVADEGNWPERSLGYLCRNFDNLNKGSDYVEVVPAYQVGLLDFTPFPAHPEFFSAYKLCNTGDASHVYTEKFRLYTVDLTNIGLATPEDKAYGLDKWAAMFKASTWEELKMIAETNSFIESAVSTVYRLTRESGILWQIEARRSYARRERARRKERKELLAKLDQQNVQLDKKNTELDRQKALLQEKESTILQKDEALREKEDVILQKDAEIERLRDMILNPSSGKHDL